MLALLAAAGLLVALALRVFAGHPRAASHYRHLARREVAFVNAVADATFPRGGEIPASGSDAGIAAYIDRWLAVSTRRISRRTLRGTQSFSRKPSSMAPRMRWTAYVSNCAP